MSPLLVPFPARLVLAEWASRVVSPAYDGLNAEARRQLMAENPYVFLHVTRSPEDDLSDDGLDELTEKNAAALESLLAAGAYGPVAEPALYLYRLELDGHAQTGVVADVPVDAYADGRLRRHERTHSEREALLARHLSRVGVSSSPVAVTYRASAEVDQIVELLQQAPPQLGFTDGSGLIQQVWRVEDPDAASALEAAFAGVPLYITDGHHRTAAALRLRDERRAAGLPVGDFDTILCVLFPDDQLRVYEFNRRLDVGDAAAVEEAGRKLAEITELRPAADAGEAKPAGPGEFAVYAAGCWQTFALVDADGPDARLLDDLVIRALLGGRARLGNIEYVPGTAGLAGLAKRCDDIGGIGFAMHPEPVEELMAVADAGGVLPPKSTFFHPKARSGIFLRFREAENHG